MQKINMFIQKKSTISALAVDIYVFDVFGEKKNYKTRSCSVRIGNLYRFWLIDIDRLDLSC